MNRQSMWGMANKNAIIEKCTSNESNEKKIIMYYILSIQFYPEEIKMCKTTKVVNSLQATAINTNSPNNVMLDDDYLNAFFI